MVSALPCPRPALIPAWALSAPPPFCRASPTSTRPTCSGPSSTQSVRPDRVHEYGSKTQETDYAIRVVAEHAPRRLVPHQRRRGAFQQRPWVCPPPHHPAGHPLRAPAGPGPSVHDRGGRRRDRAFCRRVPCPVRKRRNFIRRVVGLEETHVSSKTFARECRNCKTYCRPLKIPVILNCHSKATPEIMEAVMNSGFQGNIAVRIAFILYDTYGFPPELVDEIGRREYGLAVDMDGFNSEMEAKRERDRAGHQVTGSMEIVTAYENLGAGRTPFDGYQRTKIETRASSASCAKGRRWDTPPGASRSRSSWLRPAFTPKAADKWAIRAR